MTESLITSSVITEVKHQLDGQVKTFDCKVLCKTKDELIVYYKMPKDYSLHGVSLKKGMISFGYFWPSRFYNLYHWVDTDGRSVALYFNVCDSTRLTEYKVEWRDLVVDVLMTDSGPASVLDEDELSADLDDDIMYRITNTRDFLCANKDDLVKEFSIRSRLLYQQII